MIRREAFERLRQALNASGQQSAIRYFVQCFEVCPYRVGATRVVSLELAECSTTVTMLLHKLIPFPILHRAIRQIRDGLVQGALHKHANRLCL